MTKKENEAALKLIQKEYINQKKKDSLASPEISPDKLKKLKIDTSQKKIPLGNLLLKKDLIFSENFSINLVDKKKDLDGLLLKDHPNLLKRLQKLWDQGEKKIPYEDLWKLNIYTSLSTIKAGNFEIYSGLLSGSNYSISLIDEEKDGYGRWVDSAVDYEKVVKALDAFKLTKSKCKTIKETSLNSELEKHLRTYFDNCNKSKGNLKGIFDLEIGDLTYVIEMKMAVSAKKTDQRDRAYGQMKRYLDEHKSKKFMLLVAGMSADKQDTNIKSLKKAAEEDFGVKFYFMEAE